MLDKFEVVLHSPDQIAPVGVLHPLEFHLEQKSVLLSDDNNDQNNEVSVGEFNSVHEVVGDCLVVEEASCPKNDVISDIAVDTKQELHFSKSKKDNTFSIACWLQDASKTSTGMILNSDGILFYFVIYMVMVGILSFIWIFMFFVC